MVQNESKNYDANERTETAGPQPPEHVTVTSVIAAMAEEPRPFPRIPGLRVVREIGRGGMGDVYEVVEEKLEIVYALKVIRPDRVGQRFLTRFRREARTMVGLDHPHIARFYTYGETADGPYFTMKYLPDGTLADRIGQFAADPRRAVALMIQIADAVHYLHTKGYIHRDLKPNNILFGGDEPFVSDFGLAKEHGDLEDSSGSGFAADRDTERNLSRMETRAHESPTGPIAPRAVTATAGVVGTLPYMSPEQLQGVRGTVTAQSDVWSLGVILYELLLGSRPFDSEDHEVLSELIRKADPHPPQRYGASIGPVIEKIIRKCLAKEPRERYQSASQFAGDLRAWLDSQKAVRSRRWRIAAGAALVLIAAVAAYYGLRDRPGNVPTKEVSNALIRDVPVDDFLTRLGAGETVQVMGARGQPAYLNWRAGTNIARVHEWSADKALTITVDGLALLEILDRVPLNQFTFAVDVRVNDLRGGGGLYVGHQTIEMPRGVGHFFLAWSFYERLERGRNPAASKRHVCFWYHGALTDGSTETNPVEIMNLADFFPNPRVDEETPWRRLSVTVSPEAFVFQWGDQVFRRVERRVTPQRIKGLSLLASSPQPLPIDFAKPCGIGLYVSGGSVSFQNAVIIPMKD